ncbi:hypothetical protein F5144DRAFT_613657 [Chaetomium tenue]|uniref:Uncharacterized protein n=1 Tax=Chaetomium tenue TaxID=1854479 RepID=A0ACB7P1H1_9PEZI|nr:hypothetical protein F5144DRAFT_613657 [Chaetomium globosum]
MTTQQELVPVAGAKALPLLWVLGISWDFLGSPEFEFHLFLGNGSRKRAKGPRNLGEARWFLAQTSRQDQAKSGQEQPRRGQEGPRDRQDRDEMKKPGVSLRAVRANRKMMMTTGGSDLAARQMQLAF